MKKSQKAKDFAQEPVFEGGMEKISAFVSKQVKYPAQALEAQVEGTVTIKYDIDGRGRVKNATVTKGLGFGLDEEAIRVVNLFRFTANQKRGINVLWHRSININFKLPVKQLSVNSNQSSVNSNQSSVISGEEPVNSNQSSVNSGTEVSVDPFTVYGQQPVIVYTFVPKTVISKQ